MNGKCVVIVSCVCPPETVVAGRVNWDIAERLAQRGYSVTFISPIPSRPLGKFSNELPFDRVLGNGVRHIQIKSYVHPKNGLWGRIRESISFGVNASKAINHVRGKVDLIYCMPWPFLGQLLVLLKSRAIKTKIVMNVQDLYPESFLNKIRFEFIKKVFNPLVLVDKYIALRSDHLTVVSKSLKKVYVESRGVANDDVTVIENWQDEAPFLGFSASAFLYEKYGLLDIIGKRVFMYLGNIGPVAGLEAVIKGFAEAKIDFAALVIAGSGTSKSDCEILVKSLNLSNVHFVEIGPDLMSVVELQSLASICLLPIVPGGAASSIPSKMIAYMFSKKPILSSAEKGSFTGDVIEKGCGWLVSGYSSWSTALASAASCSDNEIYRRGEMGFDYAIKNFSKSVGLEKIEYLVERMI